MLQHEQISEELRHLKSRFEDLIGEHQAALTNTKAAARQEVKNEIQELARRLDKANNCEAELKVITIHINPVNKW